MFWGGGSESSAYRKIAINLNPNPKGPCTQYLGTWDFGNSTYSTDLGQVFDYWVLGPLG